MQIPTCWAETPMWISDTEDGDSEPSREDMRMPMSWAETAVCISHVEDRGPGHSGGLCTCLRRGLRSPCASATQAIEVLDRVGDHVKAYVLG